jgi:hypothetical protein
MKRGLWVAGALVVALAMAGEAQGQEESRFGVGFQSAWPAYGLSGLYDVNDRVTAQAIIGAFGTVSTLSGRLIYDFQQQPKHALYGFGTTGVWRHSYSVLGVSDSESSFSAGGGAGIELDWRAIVDGDAAEPTFPRLFSSFDISFVATSFEFYDFSGLVIGAGLHYRF